MAGSDGAPREGDLLDHRWRLDAPIGGGAFGMVWSAFDVQVGRRVAVKLLHDAHLDNPKVLGRFEQEAQIQAKLAHPGIVPVLAWSTAPVAYLVMPLVEGESLHDRCAALAASGRRLPLPGVTWLVEQMAGAIATAHDAGVIHRDLKPKNVLVTRVGQRPFVKVLDFGVAKILEGGRLPATTVGRVMGSVLYLAPEQVTGGSAASSVAVDQFALASIVFELLSGRRAWARDDDGQPLAFHVPVATRGDNRQMSVARRIVHGDRPRLGPLRPEVGPAVEAILERAFDLDPRRRFPDVRTFGSELRSALVEADVLGGADYPGDLGSPPGDRAPGPQAPMDGPLRDPADETTVTARRGRHLLADEE